MKPLLLLLLLVTLSGRLTPTHTTSWALIRRTGSAEPSDSYNSSERSTEHQNRWKSVHTRAQTPTYTPTQTHQVHQYAGQLTQSAVSRQSVSYLLSSSWTASPGGGQQSCRGSQSGELAA